MRPCVGLSPTMPQTEAGLRTDPPLSEPMGRAAIPGVLPRPAAGEFVQVGLSHEDGSRVREPPRDLGVRAREPSGEKARSCRRGDARGVEDVLQADGDSVKRSLPLSPRSFPLARPRPAERLLGAQ